MNNREIAYSHFLPGSESTPLVYAGHIDNAGTTQYTAKALEKRLGRLVHPLYITNQFLPHTEELNLVVVNEELKAVVDHGGDPRTQFVKGMATTKFLDSVGDSSFVYDLLKKLTSQNGSPYVNLFSGTPFGHAIGESLARICAKPDLYRLFDNKLVQRSLADKLSIPTAKGEVVESREEMLKAFRERYSKTGAFVVRINAGDLNSGGYGCAIVEDYAELIDHPNAKLEGQYLITEKLDRVVSPASLGLVANSEEVIVCSVADQMFRGEPNSTFYGGTVFPSICDDNTVQTMFEYTEMLGKEMGAKGFRGFFGVDYVITSSGEVYFAEINPRKINSTLPNMRMLNPQVNLAELELQAIFDSTFSGRTDFEVPTDTAWLFKSITTDQDLILPTSPELEQSCLGSSVIIPYLPGTLVPARGKIGLATTEGRTREEAARKMADLEARIKLAA